MNKQIFRKGDKVFDVIYGWGKVTEVYCHQDRNYPVSVEFENSIIKYTHDGKWNTADSYSRLSFTEYGFDDRFSQERPINYENYMRKWGKFWNGASDNIFIDVLDDLCEDCDGNVKFVPYEINSHYDHFEPLTDEQLKVLGLENS